MRASERVVRSQRVYRALLRATASPGELVRLVRSATAAHELVLTTLLDREVSFCAIGGRAREVEERLVLATGARIAALSEADFLLVLGGGSGGRVLELKRGTLEEPAEGATAIYAVERLGGREPLTLSLSGPGVPGERTVTVGGLERAEAEAIRESRSSYPLGVDVYLTDLAGIVVGLPRSTPVGLVP